MSTVLPFTLPPSRGVAIDQATADLIIAGDVITSFAAGNLRHKCAVVQLVVEQGKPVGDMTVDQLVAIIRKAGR